MIFDERRKIGEYGTRENLPEISPMKYNPTVTGSGSRANLADL